MTANILRMIGICVLLAIAFMQYKQTAAIAYLADHAYAPNVQDVRVVGVSVPNDSSHALPITGTVKIDQTTTGGIAGSYTSPLIVEIHHLPLAVKINNGLLEPVPVEVTR